MRAVVFALAATLLGCAQPAQQYEVLSPEETLINVRARQDAERRAPARASKATSEARGDKSCLVTNFQGLGVQGYRGASGPLLWRVRIGKGDLYPGTDVYMELSGRRYSAKEGAGISVTPDILSSFMSDHEATVSWSNWPTGGSERTVQLTNFGAAYAECVEFLSTKVP